MQDKRVVKKGFIELDGVDWSAFCTGVTVSRNGNAIVINTFGSDNVSREGGLIDNGYTIQMVHPTDDSFNAQFWDKVSTKITVRVRWDSTAGIGDENPSYDGVAILENWDTGGGVGDAASFTLSLPVDGAINRVTA